MLPLPPACSFLQRAHRNWFFASQENIDLLRGWGMVRDHNSSVLLIPAIEFNDRLGQTMLVLKNGTLNGELTEKTQKRVWDALLRHDVLAIAANSCVSFWDLAAAQKEAHAEFITVSLTTLSIFCLSLLNLSTHPHLRLFMASGDYTDCS